MTREPTRDHSPGPKLTREQAALEIGRAYLSTQGGGASHDGLGVLVSTTFSSFQNHALAHDLPRPSWVERKVYLTRAAPPRRH